MRAFEQLVPCPWAQNRLLFLPEKSTIHHKYLRSNLSCSHQKHLLPVLIPVTSSTGRGCWKSSEILWERHSEGSQPKRMIKQEQYQNMRQSRGQRHLLWPLGSAHWKQHHFLLELLGRGMQHPQTRKKNILTILKGAGKILCHRKELAANSFSSKGYHLDLARMPEMLTELHWKWHFLSIKRAMRALPGLPFSTATKALVLQERKREA